MGKQKKSGFHFDESKLISPENPFDAGAYLESIQPPVDENEPSGPQLSDAELAPLVRELKEWAGRPAADLPEKFGIVFRQQSMALSWLGSAWDMGNAPERLIRVMNDWLYWHDPERENERLVDHYNAIYDAHHWFKIQNLQPMEAALLLCRQHPKKNPDPDNTYVDGDDAWPGRYHLLLRAFEDEASVSPQHRSLLQWRTIARERGLTYHPWIEKYLDARTALTQPTEPAAQKGGADETANDGQDSTQPNDDQKELPPYLTTTQLVECFSGYMGVDDPAKVLSGYPDWAIRNKAMVVRGRAGKPSLSNPDTSQWNPALFALNLLEKKPVPMLSGLGKLKQQYLDTPFSMKLLQPWKQEWNKVKPL